MPIQDATSELRRVYVRAPRAEDLEAWSAYGWHAAPDSARAADEHAALRDELARAGAEVVEATTPVPGDADAIYAFDPLLLTDAGAILLRPGKEGRRAEPQAMAADLEALGVPMLGALDDPATAEGGDLFWLDSSTLLAARGYRTNDAGIERLRKLLPDAQVEAFDLPHRRGPGECLHLMSLISPLAPDLVVGHLPLMPVRLVELLLERGVRIVEVPDEELDSMGPNVLALAPRVALALDGNPLTRRRLEAAGVDVRTYRGDEISRKGDGGPTCLTRPLSRGEPPLSRRGIVPGR
ncbi:MAG TPA: arginine deiminase family protein [Actinomycetota bacterium]|nr:arginine deiminase family protein [Actinomycetota bacterium]